MKINNICNHCSLLKAENKKLLNKIEELKNLSSVKLLEETKDLKDTIRRIEIQREKDKNELFKELDEKNEKIETMEKFLKSIKIQYSYLKGELTKNKFDYPERKVRFLSGLILKGQDLLKRILKIK